MANLNSPCAENWIFILDFQLSSIGTSGLVSPTKVWEPPSGQPSRHIPGWLIITYYQLSSGNCQQSAVWLLGAPPLPDVAAAACQKCLDPPVLCLHVRGQEWLIDQALDAPIGVPLGSGHFSVPESRREFYSEHNLLVLPNNLPLAVVSSSP